MDSLIIFGAKYLFIAVVLLWILSWQQANQKSKKQIIVATVAAIVIAVIFDKIASKLYYDPRPFVTNHIKPLVAHAADNGFPSEHTLFSMTLAVTILCFRPKLGWAAVVIALIVGIARVAAHVHTPIDIAGGSLIGLIAGYLGYLLSMRIFKDKQR
jgi:undecaprenyl-diphosphatase